MATYDTKKVSVGKPKVGGAVYRAPLGSTLPTDAKTDLDAAFICLGYVSEDGLENEISVDSDEIKAWGGDTVAVIQKGKSETYKFTLIQILDPNVLEAVYNTSNISGELTTGMTVRINSDEAEAAAYVFEIILTDGAKKRIVAPNAKLSELGTITYKDDEAIGFETTITALPGDADFGYDMSKEYIIKESTTTGA